jgi:hypothetical protein
MIQFTVITATNCELTKRFALDENGRIDSSAIAHMTEGHARVEQLDNLAQLGGFLPLLTPHQAITCGVPAKGHTPLTTRAGAEFRHDAVARTNEAFHFPYGAALYPIDVDVDGDEFPTVASVLDALEACSPWLAHVYRVARPSSSSFVGARGLRGVHIYIAVTRGTDIPDLAKRMQIEQWSAGRGYVKISKSGALLTRQLSDHAVYQPSRLMFEASPVLAEGVTRNVAPSEAFIERAPMVAVGHPVRYKREDGMLDVQELPKMRDIETRRFDTAVRNAKNARRREAKRIAIDYQTQNAIANGLDPKVGERYGLLATRALGEKKLPPSWSVYVKAVGVQTVAQIVAALPDSLGFQCADPFDTWRLDIGPKHCSKAEIVMMQDAPGIWSHKLQEFFAFTDDTASDLSSPLEQAAEKLCGLIEFPEALDKKAASELNVAHALALLLREADLPVRYNLSTYRAEVEDLPEALTLKYALARVGCLRVGKGTLENAIGDIARSTPYDPWKDAMLALPVWDKTPRLDTFFADLCGTVNTHALEATGQAFLSAIVMRQLAPGAVAPVVPVLIGGQGIGKTRFVEQLAHGLGAPKPPAIAFGDGIRMSMEACTSIIAELSEMSGMGKREAEEIKSWVSATDDVYRAPYERTAEHHPRRFVLIGTANKHELNRDETGNRRLMPIFVERPIDPNWSVELHQLLAEAKERFCQPDAYAKLCRTAADAVRDHNAEDMKRGVGTLTSDLDDLLPPILRGHLRNPGETRVPSSAIRKALDLTPTGRQFSAQKVAQWLRTRNWQPGTDSQGMRFYAPPQDYVDVDDNKPLLSVVSPFTTERTA